MVIITDANDTVTVKNPHTGEIVTTFDGKIISENAIVSFARTGIYWAWTLHEFDANIVDNVVEPRTGRDAVVNPDGFIYQDEIYKIQVDPI